MGLSGAMGHRERVLILLTGLSGAGKSTVGRLVAQALDLPFVDLDDRIAAEAGMDVGAIFDKLGEAHFRRLEAASLAAACEAGVGVVACGGGALVSAESRALARAAGTVVWMQVSPEVASGRVGQSERRPLLAGEAASRLTALLAARAGSYADCDFAVRADGRSAAEVAVEVVVRVRGPA